MRIDIPEFSGTIGLIMLNSGNMLVNDGAYQYWERPKAGKFPICGKGMKWLLLVPDNTKHVITAMYQENDNLSVCYVDMIDSLEYDHDGTLVFIVNTSM